MRFPLVWITLLCLGLELPGQANRSQLSRKIHRRISAKLHQERIRSQEASERELEAALPAERRAFTAHRDAQRWARRRGLPSPQPWQWASPKLAFTKLSWRHPTSRPRQLQPTPAQRRSRAEAQLQAWRLDCLRALLQRVRPH